MDPSQALCIFTGQHPVVDGDVTDRYATEWITTRQADGVHAAEHVPMCGDHAALIPFHVAHVKAHAVAHYDDGGWDVVVECWDDTQITNEIVEARAATIEAAIHAFTPVVGVYADRQADARNSAF